MSADYDRLFHSPDVVKTAEEETAHVDPDTVTPGSAGSDAIRRAGTQRGVWSDAGCAAAHSDRHRATAAAG